MENYFTDTFFRFLLGFVMMIAASFSLIFGVDYYAQHTGAAHQVSAAAAAARVPHTLNH